LGVSELNATGFRTQRRFMNDFKHFFLRGLATILPALLTIAILMWAYKFIDRNIGYYVTRSIVALATASGQPPPFVDPIEDALKYGDKIDEIDRQGRQLTKQFKVLTHPNIPDDVRLRTEWEIAARKYRLGLLGFVVAILLIYFVGYLMASFMGRTAWRTVESLLMRTPIVGAIYPNVKQVTDFVLSERKFEFSAVVAVEYPRKGAWSLGFVTGPGFKTLHEAAGEELVVVFIPSSPTPVTGYAVIVPRKDVVELPWSVDEALRFTISGGVIRPAREVLPEDLGGADLLPGPAAGEADNHDPDCQRDA